MLARMTACLFAIFFSVALLNPCAAEPLHSAAKRGDLPRIQQLITDGFGVNDHDKNGRTPLH